MKKYENVILLQYDDAAPLLNKLNNGSEKRILEVLEYLKDWHYPGEHEIIETQEKKMYSYDCIKIEDYIIYYSNDFESVGLLYILDDGGTQFFAEVFSSNSGLTMKVVDEKELENIKSKNNNLSKKGFVYLGRFKNKADADLYMFKSANKNDDGFYYFKKDFVPNE